MMTYKQANDNNQAGKFWLYETPEVMQTGRNTIRYYPKAKRLVIHLPDYQSPIDGEMKPGKGCGLNLDALAESPEVVDRLLAILNGLKI